MLDLHGGRTLFTCAQPLLLPSPSEGLARWLKSRSTLRNTKGAHPNSHLHLIRVHRAVLETQKAAKNRLKKRRATTTTHHAVGSRHRDEVVRWNEAFCSLFSSVFCLGGGVTRYPILSWLFCRGNVFHDIKNPAKDFCWWDLGGVCLVSVCAVVDGSLDLFARSTCFFI